MMKNEMKMGRGIRTDDKRNKMKRKGQILKVAGVISERDNGTQERERERLGRGRQKYIINELFP